MVMKIEKTYQLPFPKNRVFAGTQIDLVHSKFQKQESVDRHSSGWDSYMEGFKTYLPEQHGLS